MDWHEPIAEIISDADYYPLPDFGDIPITRLASYQRGPIQLVIDNTTTLCDDRQQQTRGREGDGKGNKGNN